MRSMIVALLAGAGTMFATAAVAQDDALLARGEYLVNGPVACGNCHNGRNEKLEFIPGKELAGGFHVVEEGAEGDADLIVLDQERVVPVRAVELH